MTQQAQQCDRRIIRQMLAAAQRRAPQEAQSVESEAADYDWQTPCRFLRPALEKLDAAAARFGRELSKAVGGLLQSEVEFQPVGVAQHYAGRLRESAADRAVHFTELTGPEGEHCGLVTLPPDMAAAWVARLLGGSTGEDDRELSALETDLLMDILRTMAQGISADSQAVGGPALAHGQTLSRGAIALPGEDTDEYCEFAFEVSASEKTSQVFLLIASETVDRIIGVEHSRSSKGPEQVRQDLLGHLRQAPIAATLRLGEAAVTMREAMALEAGDVVLLQRHIDEPAEIVIQDRAVLLAHPVTCEDRYGAEIVSWTDSQAECRPPRATDRTRP